MFALSCKQLRLFSYPGQVGEVIGVWKWRRAGKDLTSLLTVHDEIRGFFREHDSWRICVSTD